MGRDVGPLIGEPGGKQYGISRRGMREVQEDIETTGHAVVVKTWTGRARRLDPRKYLILEPVFSQEAVEAAKKDGSLVAEVKA